jgi:predicted RNA-binding protein with PIN domain
VIIGYELWFYQLLRTDEFMNNTRYVIVDGYNLMHKVGMHRPLNAPGNLARSRFFLIQSIARHFTPEQQRRITIVFDASLVPALDAEGTPEAFTHEMTISFASEFENADAMIEHLLRQHSAPKQVLVVSSDRQVQTSASRRRAAFMESEAWYDSLERWAAAWDQPSTLKEDPISEIRDQLVDEQEREYWLREFGLDDTSE